MENASKALTIAGGVMMGIMIVGLLIFGFQRLRSYQNTQDEATRNQQLADYNNQLEAYNKQIVPGYQMISLAHLANDLNDTNKKMEYGYDEVTVKVNMKYTLPQPNSRFGIAKQADFNNFVHFINDIYPDLDDNGDENSKKAFKELYFKCTKVEANKTNGRINKMEFEELKKK